MKKSIISLLLAMALLLGVSVPTLAWGGENAGVDISDVTVTGGQFVGVPTHISGMVTITADASCNGFGCFAVANSDAGYNVVGPSGAIDSGSSSQSGMDMGMFSASADAGQTYTWSTAFVPTEVGVYTVDQNGFAFAGWATLFPPGLGGDIDSAFDLSTFSVGVAPGSPMFGYLGKFLVIVNGNSQYHVANWVEDKAWLYGRTLAEDLCAEWQVGWGGEMHQFRLFIPEGTEINGMANMKAYAMDINIYMGRVTFPHVSYICFSQPVTLSEFIDGEWIVLLVFDQIVNGQPSLAP